MCFWRVWLNSCVWEVFEKLHCWTLIEKAYLLNFNWEGLYLRNLILETPHTWEGIELYLWNLILEKPDTWEGIYLRNLILEKAMSFTWETSYLRFTCDFLHLLYVIREYVWWKVWWKCLRNCYAVYTQFLRSVENTCLSIKNACILYKRHVCSKTAKELHTNCIRNAYRLRMSFTWDLMFLSFIRAFDNILTRFWSGDIAFEFYLSLW